VRRKQRNKKVGMAPAIISSCHHGARMREKHFSIILLAARSGFLWELPCLLLTTVMRKHCVYSVCTWWQNRFPLITACRCVCVCVCVFSMIKNTLHMRHTRAGERYRQHNRVGRRGLEDPFPYSPVIRITITNGRPVLHNGCFWSHFTVPETRNGSLRVQKE